MCLLKFFCSNECLAAISGPAAVQHALRMLRSLQGEEFKRSLAAQRELLFYLSIKESVFTRALTSVLNISAS